MSLPTILSSLEHLVVEIALWVLLVPKTLGQMVLHPSAIVLMAGNSNGAGPSDDEYVSPVLLWLIVGVLPAVPVVASKWGGPEWIAHPLLADLGVEPRLASVAALLLLGPLAFAAAQLLIARKPFSRQSLRTPFAVQCGCFAPLLLAYFLSIYARLQAILTVHETIYSVISVGLLAGGIGWFCLAEHLTLRAQLCGSRGQSLVAFALGLFIWVTFVLASRLVLLVLSAFYG